MMHWNFCSDLPSSSVSICRGELRTPSPIVVLADTSTVYSVYLFKSKQKKNNSIKQLFNGTN